MPPRQKASTTPATARKPLDFQTAKRRKEPIPFVLDGEEYEFTPQKNSLLVMPSMGEDLDGSEELRGIFDWLGAGLPDEQEQRIITRLKDPEDDLDLDMLNKVASALIEEISGRPTT